MREVHAGQLADIARGAAILGTGGGGDPYVGRLFAEQAIARHGPVQVVDIDEVPADALVVPVAMMGAPTVMVEKVPSGAEVRAAVAALSRVLGEPITHLSCIEAGGGNSMIPFAAAAEAGLPLIDADGMGRAFPELQMVLPTLAGISATPLALTDEKGNVAILDTIDNAWAERLARSITVDMGCSAMLAIYVMRGHQLAEALVSGTLSLAEQLGALVRESRASHGDAIEAIIARLRAHLLFTGKVIDVERRTTTGFARGSAHIEGIDAFRGQKFDLEFQNEHLVARRDSVVVASVPDLVCVLDAASGEPVTTESLRFGLRVSVIGAPCDLRWRSERGLALVGPAYFGYDHDYVPVEALNGAKTLAG